MADAAMADDDAAVARCYCRIVAIAGWYIADIADTAGTVALVVALGSFWAALGRALKRFRAALGWFGSLAALAVALAVVLVVVWLSLWVSLWVSLWLSVWRFCGPGRWW